MFSVAVKESSPAKSRDEAVLEKRQELEKRLENVKGVLGATSVGPRKNARKASSDRASEFVFGLSLVSHCSLWRRQKQKLSLFLCKFSCVQTENSSE